MNKIDRDLTFNWEAKNDEATNIQTDDYVLIENCRAQIHCGSTCEHWSMKTWTVIKHIALKEKQKNFREFSVHFNANWTLKVFLFLKDTCIEEKKREWKWNDMIAVNVKNPSIGFVNDVRCKWIRIIERTASNDGILTLTVILNKHRVL